MTPASAAMRRRAARDWASASAAASSACSIAKSFSNGSNDRATVDLVQTALQCGRHEILTKNGEVIAIDNPQKVPEGGQIEEFREPFVRISFPVAFWPTSQCGDLMGMCTERRGIYDGALEYLSSTRSHPRLRNCRWRRLS